jgi:hypothetical protein
MEFFKQNKIAIPVEPGLLRPMEMPVPNLLVLKDRSAYGPDEFMEVTNLPFKLRKFTVGAFK